MSLLDLLQGAPWWAVWILIFLVVVAYCVARVAKAVLPPPPDRGQWWRDFWNRSR
ncbi:hypothetical protein [Streptomyces flavofungini]|uniref:hypothetical protein n=1 Tax=Streptomyces flavofungini TaxID=68200 RepID=UPI0025B065AF|nr:hypothetical protein [Streptomyces flavofungini]WJV47114.1 hypothetical protein QUY26_17250 [Streptomyces flavofungini]